MPEFTHLHVHTQYSILDGAAGIPALVAKAKASGMNALAITDHGNMYGVLKFSEQAKKQGIKPIIGCEMYVAANSRHEKKGKEDRSGYHLILLAKNLKGYRNLSKLCSLGFKEGFYYTPRIDKELLRQYNEGLIALSACLGGEIPSTILNRGEEAAEKVLLEYLDIFGDDFYLEVHRLGYPEQDTVNPVLQKLGAKHNVKLVAANDIHYVNKEDFEAHQILICLNTGKELDDENKMTYTGEEYMKTPEEMAELFADIPEAITNTAALAEKIEDFEITTKNIQLPVFPLPEGFSNGDDYLHHLTYEGATKRYKEITPEIQERLDFELSVVKNMGFAGYFLIVQDFINQAREMGVMVGPGRGSAAGSAVAYCVGITNIDPIKYNLLFERFLNPERISMPDIDVDFDDDGRDNVIRYVAEKYGEEKVAQIITFGTMAAKSAIRDVARVLKLPLSEADRLAKLVPERPGISLKDAFKEVKELTEARAKGEPLVKKTLQFAEVLEGSARHTGTHACGVIIGPTDLTEYIPLSSAKDSTMMVTQYDGKYVESVGMLKMDFLGLKNLTIIKDAIDTIHQRHGVHIDIEQIPPDDEKTFELFQRGETIGTFQFESEGMRMHLKELKPNCIEDLIAMNALYRPGPMDYIPLFINRKQGRDKVEYPHPMLEKILKPTYGIMVYQEQIMQAAQIMGGFTLGKADLLRRAMGKKQKEVMDAQREIFVEGAMQKGIEKEKAEEVFGFMEKFAEYGFNRSHSAAYSVIAYQTAYLKAHYPAEYMAAILTHNLSDIKKITFYIDECKRMNLPVLGPDVNESEYKFAVNKNDEIRFGLAAIKNVGESAAISIIEECKNNGEFVSIFDFVKRINLKSVNKRCIEGLAYAGAFDSFKKTHRAQLFYQEKNNEATFIEKLIKHASSYQSLQDASQQTLFGEAGTIEVADPDLPECEPWSRVEQLKHEKDVTGFYFSGHPLDDHKLEMDSFCSVKISGLNENLKSFKDRGVIFSGMITTAAHRLTKTGKPFGSFTLEDFEGSVNLMLFSEDYLKFKHFLDEGTFVLVKARVQNRYKDAQQLEIKVTQMILLAEAMEKMSKEVSLILPLNEVNNEMAEKLAMLAKKSKGNCKLNFKIIDPDEQLEVNLNSKKFKVNCSTFLKELKETGDIKYKIIC